MTRSAGPNLAAARSAAQQHEAAQSRARTSQLRAQALQYNSDGAATEIAAAWAKHEADMRDCEHWARQMRVNYEAVGRGAA